MAKITIIAPAYLYEPILLPSLLVQTHTNWECLVLHDTYNERYVKYIEYLNDPRIKLYFSKERRGKWGHPLRQVGLTQISPDTDYIIHTNCDNYYTPNACELLLKGFEETDAVMTYCDCLHSHIKWQILHSALKYCQIDCGCCLIKVKPAVEIGWKSLDFESDWQFLQELISKYGIDKCVHIRQVLFSHN